MRRRRGEMFCRRQGEVVGRASGSNTRRRMSQSCIQEDVEFLHNIAVTIRGNSRCRKVAIQ